MNRLRGYLYSQILSVLIVCFFMLLFTVPNGVASNSQSAFDVEAVKEEYSIRDYVYVPLPERGYHYFKIAENAYFVHDEFEHIVFFVTEEGVVVYDPKPDVTPFLLEVIPEVTNKPITHVIYSHHHRDHSQSHFYSHLEKL